MRQWIKVGTKLVLVDTDRDVSLGHDENEDGSAGQDLRMHVTEGGGEVLYMHYWMRRPRVEDHVDPLEPHIAQMWIRRNPECATEQGYKWLRGG